MNRRIRGWYVWPLALAAGLVMAPALPVVAQNAPSVIKGVVKDTTGKPVEGVKVMIDFNAPKGSSEKHYEATTDKKGEYLQVVQLSGSYRITAEKDKLMGAVTARVPSAGSNITVDVVLGGGAAGAEGVAALKKSLQTGIEAMQAGDLDGALAAFEGAIKVNPGCHECYYAVGSVYNQKKDYEKAEAAYKKAVEIKPDYVDAYTGLANLYNTQRKFDLATAASQKATELASSTLGGGGADALYNQGVILWNTGKIPEAKKQFEAAVAADPNHAEAHYQLGMSLVNEGNLAGAASEFEKYLQLSPSGPNAPQAKALLSQLKK